MSTLDFFKPLWSSVEIGDDDRRKIFWYLKRKSSYSAWKLRSEAFDHFAAIFERQVIEEPNVAWGNLPPEWGTNWESYWPDVLKAQSFYEEGLERLRQGDRTVWLYNDRGVLGDANVEVSTWYSNLVNHGAQGDKSYEGKYVAELKAAILAASAFSRATAGILQPMVANTPAPDSFSRKWLVQLEHEVPFPAVLPQVPEPGNLTVRSGEEIPVFGIYEPQVPDGCMNYLLAGVPAPDCWVHSKHEDERHQRPVAWQLIWEDQRYLDGGIPAEERIYFVPQKDDLPNAIATVTDLLTAASNDSCPRSGVWVVADDISARSVFNSGEKLPSYSNREVTWVWVAKSDSQ